MDLQACVSIPSFPLQVLLRRVPEWRDLPAAVLDEDKPLGLVTYCTKAAYLKGVRKGMKYSTALVLCPELSATAVGEEEMAAANDELVRLMGTFTPGVEISDFHTGVFWLDARGLERLYTSTLRWARKLLRTLKEQGFSARAAVGRTRLGTYAGTLQYSDPVVFETEQKEQEVVETLPLSKLPFTAKTAARLSELRIETAGELAGIPAGAISIRFDESALALHRFLRSELEHPLQPAVIEEAVTVSRTFTHPIGSSTMLMHHVSSLLELILANAEREGRLVRTLHITLFTEDSAARRESVVPAHPSGNAKLLRLLCTLRLETVDCTAGIIGMEIRPELVERSSYQRNLFAATAKRSRIKAEEAFELIRAELGNGAITTAEPANEHLPENSYAWRPCVKPPGGGTPSAARSPDTGGPSLMRTIAETPESFDPRSLTSPHSRVHGPYRLMDKWWAAPEQRDYYFVEDPPAGIMWVYYDRRRKRWRRQGYVG